jgi:N-methylhydantoinase B/oxoprolinase/acetone carboxylase alpha subunit
MEVKGLEQPAKSLGIDHISFEAKHKAKQSASLLDYRAAIDSLIQSRQEVQRLIDRTGRDEHYVLSILGPILAELREATVSLEKLEN